MAWEARSGLKRNNHLHDTEDFPGLNGLGSPFGFETTMWAFEQLLSGLGLNGLGSPFGFETFSVERQSDLTRLAKWPGKPVRV